MLFFILYSVIHFMDLKKRRDTCSSITIEENQFCKLLSVRGLEGYHFFTVQLDSNIEVNFNGLSYKT